MDVASEAETADFLQDVFAEELDGHRLITNRSLWRQFPTVRATPWSSGRVVLLGDAAHTAHFSVGSGTRMAMEDAIALKKVLAFARFTGREVTLEMAREALRDILHVASRQISVDGIQKTVAEYFKIKISDMHSKKRSRNVARPRQVAMSLAKELTPMSLPEIGEAFGNRDHTTVLHACRTISTLRKKDSALNRDYLVLEQVLKG